MLVESRSEMDGGAEVIVFSLPITLDSSPERDFEHRHFPILVAEYDRRGWGFCENIRERFTAQRMGLQAIFRGQRIGSPVYDRTTGPVGGFVVRTHVCRPVVFLELRRYGCRIRDQAFTALLGRERHG